MSNKQAQIKRKPTLTDTNCINKGRLSGADDRTRTCTLARWNLRVMSP